MGRDMTHCDGTGAPTWVENVVFAWKSPRKNTREDGSIFVDPKQWDE